MTGLTKTHDGYVGFLDRRPHVQREAGSGGPLTITIYCSKAAAKRAYEDVRRVRLVFDAEKKDIMTLDDALAHLKSKPGLLDTSEEAIDVLVAAVEGLRDKALKYTKVWHDERERRINDARAVLTDAFTIMSRWTHHIPADEWDKFDGVITSALADPPAREE